MSARAHFFLWLYLASWVVTLLIVMALIASLIFPSIGFALRPISFVFFPGVPILAVWMIVFKFVARHALWSESQINGR